MQHATTQGWEQQATDNNNNNKMMMMKMVEQEEEPKQCSPTSVLDLFPTLRETLRNDDKNQLLTPCLQNDDNDKE